MRELEADFYIGQNDRRPYLDAICTDSAGNPLDVSAASGKSFLLQRVSDGTLKATAGTIVAGPGGGFAAGSVRYQWAVTDTSEAGDFRAEVEILWASGDSESFPAAGPVLVRITPDIA